ncbi:MAG TPA: hypothetical protein VGR03_11360 [Candidatus Acidoferrum sp.]|nr:hypothetical protein [Candidatus Acidoferrum sp.]
MKQSYPLYWPEGWKRTAPGKRVRGQFRRTETRYNSSGNSQRLVLPLTISVSVGRIIEQLGRMEIDRHNVIVSTNVETGLDGTPRSDRRAPEDPGAAVYWRDRRETERSMAIDRYDTVADNLAGIAATLEAMRAIERHGGAEILQRVFRGFMALPEASWRTILGVGAEASLQDAEGAFRELAHRGHSDKGGNEDMGALVKARDEARKELGH